MFSGLLQKDLFKEGCSSVEHFFKQNYCHACHTRFADSSPVLLRKLTTRQNRLRGRLRQVWLLTLALLRLDQRLGRRCVRLHHGNVLKDAIARPIAIVSLHHLVDVLNRYLFNNIYLFTIANKAD